MIGKGAVRVARVSFHTFTIGKLAGVGGDVLRCLQKM